VSSYTNITISFDSKNHTRLATTSSTVVAEPDVAKVGETITVRVICPSSRVLVFKTDMNKRLNDLKSEVILELSDDPESIQLFAPDVRHLNPRYRLYRAEYFGNELNESQTLAQLRVRHNETFILSPRRNTLPQTVTRTREVPGPNDALLESARRLRFAVPGAGAYHGNGDANGWRCWRWQLCVADTVAGEEATHPVGAAVAAGIGKEADGAGECVSCQVYFYIL